MTNHRVGRIRWLCGAALLVVIPASLAAMLLLVTLWPIINTEEQVLESADAIVVLAGGDGARLDRALSLIDAGVSSTLILNRGVDWFSPAAQEIVDLCEREATANERFDVICVRALPDSTKGEAITMTRIAEQHGWSSLLVVSEASHLGRSQNWFNRCFSGKVGTAASLGPRVSGKGLVIEWASLVHLVFFDGSCE